MGRALKGPPWDVSLELVACVDGPRANSWYFLRHGEGSWHSLRRLARAAGESPYDGRTLGYVPTKDALPHPTFPDLSGHVLRWDPAAAAAADAAEEDNPR